MDQSKTDPGRILLKLAGAAFLLSILALVPGGMVMSDGGTGLFGVLIVAAVILLAVYGITRLAGFVAK